MTFPSLILFLSLSAFFHSVTGQFPFCPQYFVDVYQITARNAFELGPRVARYRQDLGGVNNLNKKGPLESGFRMINWDKPEIPFKMPETQFIFNRGAKFTALQGSYRVSNPGSGFGFGDNAFSSIVPPVVSQQFKPFSGKRVFAPFADNKMDCEFQIPGFGDNPQAKALTHGWGGVFSDVDFPGETSVEYLDNRGCRIIKLFVPRGDGGLSFTGIIVKDKKKKKKKLSVISKVKIKLGNVALGNFKKRAIKNPREPLDLVVMDDFLFGEPRPDNLLGKKPPLPRG